MLINKYQTKDGGDRKTRYDLTDLAPIELEAIVNGLELMEGRNDIKSGIASWKLLDALRRFSADIPQSVEGAKK